MRWLAFSTAIALALACGSGPSDSTATHTGDETGTFGTVETSETGLAGCEGLDEATCSATTGCWPIYGHPGPCPWDTPSEYAGCMTGDGMCADATSVASPPWDPNGCWLFSSQCIPDGWTGNPACGGPDIDEAGCP